MLKRPIPISFGLNSQQSVQSVCAVIHIDDDNTETLDLSLMQGGEHIAVSPNSTVTARFVRVKDKILISDNVACEVQENGNIYIPIDNAAAHMLVGEIKIEVNIVDENDILTMQFPLVIKVNNTILADAEISPESEGTIPELLEEAKEAAESATQAAEAATEAISTKQDKLTAGQNITISDDNVISAEGGVTSYDDLTGKPSINNVTLSGNKSSDDLSLQGKLTAGNNIIISADNVISASGGVTSYKDLTDKPTVQVDGSQIVSLSGKMMFTSGFSLGSYLPGELIRVDLSDISRRKLENWQNYLYGVSLEDFDLYVHPRYNFNDLSDPLVGTDFTNIGYIRTKGECLTNTPQVFSSNISNNSRVLIIHYNAIPRAEQYHYLLRVIYFQDSSTNKIRQFAQWCYYKSEQDTTVHNVTDWCEIGGGSQIVSGVVNVNGTITFTDSEGNTFTTSGESVIGAEGFSPSATVQQTASGATITVTDKRGTTTANISNGQDGNDYVLTAQDKDDIADIVLSELPTTEGVLYGNQSN